MCPLNLGSSVEENRLYINVKILRFCIDTGETIQYCSGVGVYVQKVTQSRLRPNMHEVTEAVHEKAAFVLYLH